MLQTYQLYGLTVQSALRLPCRPSAVGVVPRPDLVLRSATSAHFESARSRLNEARSAADWFACVRLADGNTYIRWQNLFEFLVSADGGLILYRRQSKAAQDSFSVYLLGQVLSFALLAHGVEALHGTVSVVNGEAVAFVGNCGEGKSTLAAAMLARRCPMLTDDLVVLDERDGGWMVQPGVARIKLFPSVAKKVLGRVPRAARMNRWTSKLVLPLSGSQSALRPVPLRAIYVLSQSEQVTRRRIPVQLESLGGSQALLEVVRAAFNLVVVDRDRLANQFSFASRLAAGVPIRRLIYPRRLSLLPSVCDAVVSDVADLAAMTQGIEPASSRTTRSPAWAHS